MEARTSIYVKCDGFLSFVKVLVNTEVVHVNKTFLIAQKSARVLQKAAKVTCSVIGK